jgi:hypothetical protein
MRVCLRDREAGRVAAPEGGEVAAISLITPDPRKGGVKGCGQLAAQHPVL